MTSNLKTRVTVLLTATLLLCQCAADRIETVADTKTADGKLKGELAVSAHAFRLTLTNTSPDDIPVDKNGRYCIGLFLTAGARRWWTKDFTPLPHVPVSINALFSLRLLTWAYSHLARSTNRFLSCIFIFSGMCSLWCVLF